MTTSTSQRITRPIAHNAREGIPRTFIDATGTPQRIRTVTHGGAQWFVASDICKALGHRKTSGGPTILQRLPDDELQALPHGVLKGQGRKEAFIVSAAGIRSITDRSRMPSAVQLRRWLAGVPDYHLPTTANPFDDHHSHLLATIAEQEECIRHLSAELARVEELAKQPAPTPKPTQQEKK